MAAPRPPLSIVIPTYNRYALLRQTLATIANGTRLPDEVVVVDQSPDPAEEAGLAALFGHAVALRVVHLSFPSLTRSRNVGLERCSGEVLLFLDDDVLLDSDALERMLELFADPTVALVAAPDRLLKGARSKSIWDIAALLFARKKAKEDAGYVMKGAMLGRYPRALQRAVRTDWAQGFFFALRRQVLQLSKLCFDENLPAYGYGEDLDFTRAFALFARSQGMRGVLDPSIRVQHLASATARPSTRRSTFMYVMHRYYLSRKHFPKKHVYRLVLAWSDVGELIRRLATRSGAGDLLAAYVFLHRHRAQAARAYSMKNSCSTRPGPLGQRRKMLFIAPLPPPVFGQSIAAARLLSALGGAEKCHVVDYNRRRLVKSAFDYSQLKQAISFVLRVRRYARTSSLAYLTLSQSIVGNLRDLITMVLCRRLPLIVHLHGASLRRNIFDGFRVLRFLNRRAYRRVDTVIVLGDSLRRIFEGMIEPTRIEVVANFAPAASFASNAEIEAKCDGGPLRIIFVSNMIEGKGYEEAARALLDLAGEVDFEARFIGHFDAPARRKRFLELIAPCPSIFYLGGLGDERFEYLKKSHLFMLPAYLPEGQPISILEAYAAGNFVITTNQGGIRDVFRNGTNGFEVESRSVVDIAEKIRLYASFDPRERLAFARWNRDYAAASFREEVHIDALLRILRPGQRAERAP